MTIVCTGFHPAGYKEYGERFIETFVAHWPWKVKLLCYTEQPIAMTRGVCQSLWRCDGTADFIKRHAKNKEVQGRVPRPCWTPRDRVRGYSYRTDAYKFFKQLLIPEDAACRLGDGEVLCWLDGDVVTLKAVPEGFVEGLIGDFDLVYLGRKRRHSEIGFWAVRLNKTTRAFLHQIAQTYRSDAFMALEEWHSAWIWDHCRREAEANGLRARDLTPGKEGHVWCESPLAEWTDHLKGARKRLGASPERTNQK